MAELYLWKSPETYPDKLIGRYERERSPNRFLLLDGRKLPDKLPLKYYEKLVMDEEKPTIKNAQGKTHGFYIYHYKNNVYILVVHSPSLAEVLDLTHIIETKGDDDQKQNYERVLARIPSDIEYVMKSEQEAKRKNEWAKRTKKKIRFKSNIEDDMFEVTLLGYKMRDFILSNCKYPQVLAKPIFKFSASKQRLLKYDCLQSSANIPVISKRITEILIDLAPMDVQFFDSIIECDDGELKGYNFLNVTHEIKGIDFEHSIHWKYKEPSLMLKHLGGCQYVTYKIGCMGKYKLARDADWHGNLLVTREVKDAFEREKISGVRLVRPEEYYPVF